MNDTFDIALGTALFNVVNIVEKELWFSVIVVQFVEDQMIPEDVRYAEGLLDDATWSLGIDVVIQGRTGIWFGVEIVIVVVLAEGSCVGGVTSDVVGVLVAVEAVCVWWGVGVAIGVVLAVGIMPRCFILPGDLLVGE